VSLRDHIPSRRPGRSRPQSEEDDTDVVRDRGRSAQRVVVVALGLGGVCGALARYGISLALPTTATGFPWATFVINISGSAVLGFLLVVLLEQFPNARLARPVIGTGFIGAYTTFSTFMVGAILLVRAGRGETAGLYVVSSLVVGLTAVWVGMVGARLAIRLERWLQEQV
jgi:fluoride exporter